MMHTIGEGIIFNNEKELTAEDDFYFDDEDDWDNMCDDDDFEPCSICDLPDACADFGCAIDRGIRHEPEW